MLKKAWASKKASMGTILNEFFLRDYNNIIAYSSYYAINKLALFSTKLCHILCGIIVFVTTYYMPKIYFKKTKYNYCKALNEEMAGLKKQTYNLSSRERQTTDTEDIAIAREAIHG